jgi:hypothetical protein
MKYFFKWHYLKAWNILHIPVKYLYDEKRDWPA